MPKRERKPVNPRARFFWEHAGYSTPPGRAACAKELARAEVYAEQHGWQFEWEQDDSPDTSWCDACNRGEHEHTFYGCILKNEHDEVLCSLWGIDFKRNGGPCDDPYSRVVQAELASEALHEVEERARADRDAERLMAL